MPSPFPGMDPYLEGSRWMGVHGQLNAEIVRLLSPRLRPRYVAIMSERVVVEVPPEMPAAEALAAAAPSAPLQLATVIPEAIAHYTVEIRDVSEQRLVTAIEVLSPTNKRGDGRHEYLSKRRRVLLSKAHLVEIDLLRQGQRVPMRDPLPDAPYFVFVSRAPRRPVADVWPVALDQALPEVPVPLLPGDADVTLDLQQALTNVYDTVGYDLLIDYGRPPEVPLRADHAAWAEQRLREAGRRP